MKAAVFDLDNTLYDNRQYFYGAFKEIAKYISSRQTIPQREVHKALVKQWRQKTSMYQYLFNDALNLFHVPRDYIEPMVKIFNEYSGTIKPYADTIPTLQELRNRDYKLGIVTDGNVERQRRKIKLLGLEPLFDVVICSKDVEPKPSPLPFWAALDELRVKPKDAFSVGDNPLLDFKGAKEAGMTTVRILRGEFAKLPKGEHIDFEIHRLEQLLEIAVG